MHFLKVLFVTLLAVAFAAAQQELLVITGLVTYPSTNKPFQPTFNVVELTACSNINDLTQYTIAEYSSTSLSPNRMVPLNGQHPISLPSGSKIYTSQLSEMEFISFFGFVPKYFFQSNINFIGSSNLALIYQGTTTVDAYGIVGLDDSNTPADFGNGWAVRHSEIPHSSLFQVSDWHVKPGAYTSFPSTNLQSHLPVMLGNYTCGPATADASAPRSGWPNNPVPTEQRIGRRDRSRDSTPDRNRPPLATSSPNSTEAPKTPAPTTTPKPPTFKPTNPPRLGSANNRRPRGPTFPPTSPPTLQPTNPPCRRRQLSQPSKEWGASSRRLCD